MIERISESAIRWTGERAFGFGMSATYETVADKVEIVSPARFEELAERRKPTGRHDIGFNRGAPTDGLVIFTGRVSGIRWLVDMTGPGMIRRYVEDCPQLPAVGETRNYERAS